jgi:hypothetical protein
MKTTLQLLQSEPVRKSKWVGAPDPNAEIFWDEEPEPIKNPYEDVPVTLKPDGTPLFTNLSAFIEGAETEKPTVSETWPDHFLFYSGRLNEVHAEPSTGKTNVLCAASISTLEDNQCILYIDPEDTPRGFTTRMLMLGVSPEALRDRVHYLHNPEPLEIKAAQEWAKENNPKLVILDGLAESMAAVGADENNATEVLQFFRINLRPFAEAGAAVVIADHVTKSAGGRGQFARGSGAKAGRYDGVSYEVVLGKSYTPTTKGFVILKVAKDRNGGVGPRGKSAAELHFTPNADGTTAIAFKKPECQEGGFRPTAIMDKILALLESQPRATKRELRACGKSQWVDTSIDILTRENKIQCNKVGQSLIYSLLK